MPKAYLRMCHAIVAPCMCIYVHAPIIIVSRARLDSFIFLGDGGRKSLVKLHWMFCLYYAIKIMALQMQCLRRPRSEVGIVVL